MSLRNLKSSLAAALIHPISGLERILRKLSKHNSLAHGVATGLAILRRSTLRRTSVIAVTGSCGKTTTTTLVGAIMSTGGPGYVRAEVNGEFAALKALLAIEPPIKFYVQEIGVAAPGDMARLIRLIRPTIGIVTNIGSDHYKNFRSLEATAREKGKLIESLPVTGTAILNADDPHVRAMASRTKAKVLTYGVSPDADIRATESSSAWPDRLSFTLTHGERKIRLKTRLVGEHWTNSVLAAIACGVACGIDLDACADAVAKFEAVFGRCSVHPALKGPVYVLDRKAPFWTLEACFRFMREARAPRRTIVLGTISDYAGAAGRRYRAAARQALQASDRVIFVGPHSGYVRKLQDESLDRLFAFQTVYQASMFLAENSLADELILIKGSPKVDHLERVMLSQLDDVVCWREGCGEEKFCLKCRWYRIPAPASSNADSPSGESTLHEDSAYF